MNGVVNFPIELRSLSRPSHSASVLGHKSASERANLFDESATDRYSTSHVRLNRTIKASAKIAVVITWINESRQTVTYHLANDSSMHIILAHSSPFTSMRLSDSTHLSIALFSSSTRSNFTLDQENRRHSAIILANKLVPFVWKNFWALLCSDLDAYVMLNEAFEVDSSSRADSSKACTTWSSRSHSHRLLHISNEELETTEHSIYIVRLCCYLAYV